MKIERSRSMPVSSGQLEVLFHSDPVEAYSETNPAFFSARVVDGRTTTPIASARELVRWANSCDVDLLPAIVANPGAFAWFIGRIELHFVRSSCRNCTATSRRSFRSK